MANSANNGASRPFRLDPYQAQHLLNVGETKFKLDRNGVVVKKTLSCGLPLSIAAPAKAYEGIAARAIESENGKMIVTLELKHHDPELCVPLLYANNMNDISADWHSWSRLMKLPMLLVDADYKVSSVTQQLGHLLIETPIERRKRITGVKRRPNFLRRRKMGVVSSVESLSAADIIARA